MESDVLSSAAEIKGRNERKSRVCLPWHVVLEKNRVIAEYAIV